MPIFDEYILTIFDENILFSYKTKIAKFDKIMLENENMRNKVNFMELELIKSGHSEDRSDRLMDEIHELRQARDEALSQIESLQNMINLLKSRSESPVESETDFYRE